MAHFIMNYPSDNKTVIKNEIKKVLGNIGCKNVKEKENTIKTIKKSDSIKNKLISFFMKLSIKINFKDPTLTKISVNFTFIGNLLQVFVLLLLSVILYLIFGVFLSDFNILFYCTSLIIILIIYYVIFKINLSKYDLHILNIRATSFFDVFFKKGVQKLRKNLVAERLKVSELAMNNDKVLLEVKNLQTEFIIPEGTVNAVNGISYTVYKGKNLAIVGESGCGKSVSSMSLLKLIPMPPGLIKGGEVIYNNKDLLKMSEEELQTIRGKEISIIFQDPMTSLNPYMKISEQLIEMITFHLGIDKKSAYNKALEFLKLVKIPQAELRMDSYPFEFSGGMRQRVMIAIALSCNPKLLIADEPTTDLDVTIQAQVLDLLRELKEEKQLSIILITHDIGLVSEICDDVLVMYAGYIVEKGKMNDIVNNSHHPYTKKLIESVPFLDKDITRLSAIEGSPPDLLHLPKACPFYERCDYRIDKCKEQMPPVRFIKENHEIRCWIDL